MWLINTTTLQLEEFNSEDGLRYAILSHRWEDGEILFEDMSNLSTSSKAGLRKLQSSCELARSQHFSYLWVDTCCIDKKSSAELSEAINSMFRLYKNAKRCYAYLADVRAKTNSVDFKQQFSSSVWFTRSWTLQELIAPRERIVFYNTKWEKLGSKIDLLDIVSQTTKIDEAALVHAKLSDYSIAERMSWASRRQATRVEDLAYSLLGIFDINMPMLYGEGPKAFRRLQEQICTESDDETIFAWSLPPDEPESHPKSGLLAPSPAAFEYSRDLKPIALDQQNNGFALTNRGLTSKLMLAAYHPWHELQLSFLHPFADPSSNSDTSLAFLNAAFTLGGAYQFVGIFLRRAGSAPHNYVRVFGGSLENPVWLWKGSYAELWSWKPQLEQVSVRHKGHSKPAILDRLIGFELSDLLSNEPPSTLRGFRVDMAPGVSFVETSTRVARASRNYSGPVCSINIRGSFLNIRYIYLGFLDTRQPFCIVIDDKFGTKPNLVASQTTTTSMPLPTLEDLRNFRIRDGDVPWTKFKEDFKMDPQQTYTGFWAMKGNTSVPTEWTCLQPSWLGAPYKNHTSWVVRFVPYHDSYHELWKFQIEEPK